LIEIRDSRRLTGPHLIGGRAGAVLEIYGPDVEVEALAGAWRGRVRRILDAVGWAGEETAVRRFTGGASLFMSAPIDALYAACEINEWAVEAATAEVNGTGAPGMVEATRRLVREIEGERNPALLALRDAAARHRVAFLSDDDHASIGLGRGSLTFSVKEIPDPESIDWSGVGDIPLALVTGTNGKSTTVRLLASMVRAAGRTGGFSSTDGLVVGDELIEAGDYSGPEGARAILRHRDVEVAILETARGGILRRGLPVRRADAALVTNVGEDHLGEYGVNDLSTLIEAKLVVRRVVGEEGLLVLNADDPGLHARRPEPGVPTAWFSLDVNRPGLMRHVAQGGTAAWLENDLLVWKGGGGRHYGIVRVDEIPIALGGAARHNIANALAAIVVAGRFGLSNEAMAEGLRRFEGTPEENPGRGNVFRLGGVTAIVDFAHNAHGFRSLFEMAGALPARRRLILLGQAGDRTDASILEQAAITWEARPDRIIIKEMEKYLRGREKGEIPGMIESELRRLGAGDDVIGRAACEIDAVRDALAWSRPGDLLLLLVYADREETFDLLRRLLDEGWKPGDPLPG
jgi:UDP-N-acetylmuramyl tripeptide synthase